MSLLAVTATRAVTHPLRVNDTIIVQAGSYGAYLGVLQLDIDPPPIRFSAIPEKTSSSRCSTDPVNE